MKKVETAKIHQISSSILTAANVPKEDADIISDTIVYAHRKGRHTHGLNRLSIYIRKIREGLMIADTKSTIVKTSPIISILDAEHGFGQVAAYRAMRLCIETAIKYGVGIVGVRNSNNFGTAGYFGEMAADSGMIGIIMGNSAPAIAPPGGGKAILGTNPICFAFPTIENKPNIVLDMAATVAARGKIRLAARNGEKIPFGWALDENGVETDDPDKALKGTLIPIGNYKGFGLSLIVDIMAGLLTGSAFGGEVKNLNHPNELSRYGHFVMAINPEFFMTADEYNHNVEVLIKNLKNCGEEGKVTLPGEQGYDQRDAQLIPIKATQVEDTNKLAKEMGIAIKL